MSFFDDEPMLHDQGLCDPDSCRVCAVEGPDDEDEDDDHDYL